MKHILFGPAQDKYSVAFLTKEGAMRKTDLIKYYCDPLVEMGASFSDLIGFSLSYENGKAPAKLVKEYSLELLEALKDLNIKYLYVADATYFKHLTKQKPDANWGNILPCVIPGYEHIMVTPGVNHQQLAFNPGLAGKMVSGLLSIVSHTSGAYQDVGAGLLKDVQYIKRDDIAGARKALWALMDVPELGADIEGFSLSMFDCGIATIGFATSGHDAVQIQCDYAEGDNPLINLIAPDIEKRPDFKGHFCVNPEMRALLKEFITAYKGRLIWHRANFDVKVIIYTLWMDHDLDRDGMQDGLDIMCPQMHDTKIIAYLALNSTAKVSYSLKDLGQQHAGSWAQEDIKDIRKIPLDDLMKYNAVDAVTTFWLKQKLYPVMCKDKQEDLYKGLFLDALAQIIHMELVGMPMCPKRLDEVEVEMTKLRDGYFKQISTHPLVLALNTILQTEAMEKKNATLKTKQHPLSHFSKVVFNPNSPPQKVKLLYELMDLPVIDTTDSGLPSTGGEIVKRLMDHQKAASFKDLLQALIDFSEVEKVLTGFIPAFKEGRLKADGMIYLHGSFNLGGTISGRLSSSDPNMQNMPAGSTYGKLIKSIFMAAMGYLLGGADFASLEDRINALLTRDPNKLRVYTDLYDGHCLRAFSYWPEKCPGIIDTVESINSISKLFKDVRQDSKAPTFLLTYGGTYLGLMKNVGFTESEAKRIEANYNGLYQVSQQWVADQIALASKQGYVELAFGLRLRTPLLGNTLLGLKATPSQAKAESRSAGNAVSGQSWGLLTNRAAVGFMKRVRASKWHGKIHIVALIHDAIYAIWPDCAECTAWVNNNLCEEMAWQQDPLIAHPQVKIGANLDVFWPSWEKGVTLDFPITPERVIEQCKEHSEKLKEDC